MKTKGLIAYCFSLAALFLAAVSLASCDGSSDTDTDWGESVPLGVRSLRLEGEVATRAGGTPVNTDGTTIAVFLTNAGGYTPMYNKTYTCSGGTWSSTDPVYVDKRTGKALAVYDPNGLVSFGANSTITTNTLQAQVYDETKLTKLWYYDTTGANVNSTTPAVFSMAPAYSRMVLQVERDAAYLSDCKITEVTLLSGGTFYNNLPMDIATGTVQGSSTAYNATTNPLLKNEAGFVTIPSGTQNIDLLLPPQTIQNSGLALSIKVDGQVRSVTIPYASLPKLASGAQYNVPLKIVGPATLTLSSSVTEQGWSATSNMGTVTDDSSAMN